MAVAAVVLLSAAVLAAIGVAIWTNRSDATPRAQTDTLIPSDGIGVLAATDAGTGTYPVYRYSVIPGGAHNRAELVDAISRDEVVADHYRAVSLERVRAERLTEPRQAYVSYRIGDRVYWTRHKVTIPVGEAILTDGVTTIRARCGNCIASTPQLPTSGSEPLATEFEAVTPARLLPSLVHPPGEVPGLANQPAPHPENSSGWAGPLLPLIPFAAAASSGSGQTRSASEFESTHRVSDVAASSEPEHRDRGDTAPGDLIPGGLFPGGFGSPAPGPGELIPGGFIPGTLIRQTLPGGDPPLIGEDWTRNGPDQPAPIPEPSTFVLLGSGVAGALWRGWRSRDRR